MPLSVADVLAIDLLGDGRVVAGDRDLEKRAVRSVAVIEVPVDDFVRPGDLVLTTAMGIGHDAELLAGFVREVGRSGAAALLVALGPHVAEIPPAVAAVADALPLPLVTVPWELTFSDVSRVVLSRLLDEQHAVVRESLALQERLTKLVVDGADLAALTRSLATMLARPVFVTDAAGRVLARGGSGKGLEGRVVAAVRARVDAAPARGGAPDAPAESSVVLAPIESGRETCGYIATPLGATPLSAAEHLTLQHAVTAAALCFLQRRAAEETAVRLRDDFVWSLAASYIASPSEAFARARLLGYDLGRRYAGLYGKIESGGDGERRREDSTRQRILDALEGAAAHERRAVLATVVGDVVVAFIEVHRPGESLEGLAARVGSRLDGAPTKITVSWGIGAVHGGFANFRQTYREARAACQIGISVRGVGSVTHVGQTGSYRILLSIGADPESRLFWEGYLTELIDYGEQKGMDLIGTLETYLGTQGNVSETARRLGLHRQSLLYRLQRIEELTGGDLSDAQHRFALELSMHLYRLRDIMPPASDWPDSRSRRGRSNRRKRRGEGRGNGALAAPPHKERGTSITH